MSSFELPLYISLMELNATPALTHAQQSFPWENVELLFFRAAVTKHKQHNNRKKQSTFH